MIKEIFAKKIGMTQIFDENAELVGVTVLEVGPCTVLEEKEYPRKKVVKIGYQEVTKENRKIKPAAGYFNKLGTPYFRTVKEVAKLVDGPVEKGTILSASVFAENDMVDIIGTSKGRGFQGGMKRHNWSGQPASHGSMTHRRIGSNGANTTPGRVVKGKTMPGHMGDERVTVKNLKIVKVDAEKNLVFLRGSCPGHNNGTVIIRKQG